MEVNCCVDEMSPPVTSPVRRKAQSGYMETQAKQTWAIEILFLFIL